MEGLLIANQELWSSIGKTQVNQELVLVMLVEGWFSLAVVLEPL